MPMKSTTKSLSLVLALVAIAALTPVPATARAVDFLNAPGPIALNGTSYELAWSSRPSANYIKQEYVPAGQTTANYRQMLLIERVTGNVGITDAVAAQVDMLKKRKGSDPLVKFGILEKDASKEVALDFLISARDAKGALIVEWNLYRYVPAKSGVVLFAVSHRAYGDKNAKAFLANLKQLQTAQTRALLGANLPIPR